MVRKNCPICGVENTGGLPHTWHKSAHRKKRYTVGHISRMVDENAEMRTVINLVCHAVDLARQPDNWRPNPKKRTEYHREYYWRHADKRRKQRRENKSMRRRVRPLIAGLCRAVDLGRISARW